MTFPTKRLSVSPQKNLSITGLEGYETFKVDDNTIGVRPKWISVKDRLPEDNEDVLVYHLHDQHITVGYFDKDNVSFYIESDGSIFYTDDGWETEIPWAPKGGITHWMPLPTLPKEES